MYTYSRGISQEFVRNDGKEEGLRQGEIDGIRNGQRNGYKAGYAEGRKTAQQKCQIHMQNLKKEEYDLVVKAVETHGVMEELTAEHNRLAAEYDRLYSEWQELDRQDLESDSNILSYPSNLFRNALSRLPEHEQRNMRICLTQVYHEKLKEKGRASLLEDPFFKKECPKTWRFLSENLLPEVPKK